MKTVTFTCDCCNAEIKTKQEYGPIIVKADTSFQRFRLIVNCELIKNGEYRLVDLCCKCLLEIMTVGTIEEG